MNPLIQLKKAAPLLLITLTLLCFGLLPQAQAVVPPPDGGYPGENTAEGDFALLSLTTGFKNTAVGFVALGSNTTGTFNTANGFGALISNTTGTFNTALGGVAGFDIVVGININVIGAFQSGVSTTNGEVDNSTYISNIIGAGVDAGTARFVFVDQDGKLGTTALAGTGNLPSGQPQAMLNRKVEELQATVAQLTAQLGEQAAQIQKVSAQLEATKPAPQTVSNER